MSNGTIDIENFEKIESTEVKLNILFKTIVSYTEKIDNRFEAGNIRFKKLENRKLVDKGFSFIGGIIGGIIAIFTKGIFWKT